jgi:hypothetical protein
LLQTNASDGSKVALHMEVRFRVENFGGRFKELQWNSGISMGVQGLNAF